MKKIYDKFAALVCSASSDKYVHLIVGLLFGYILARLDIRIWHRPEAVAFGIAVISGFFVGLAKEVFDFFVTYKFSLKDWIFTFVGSIIGAALIFI